MPKLATVLVRLRLLVILILVGMQGTGCELTDNADDERIVAGISFDELFRDATPTEIADIRSEWAGRTTFAANVETVLEQGVDLSGKSAKLRIVSHSVGGVRHFGGIITPDGAAAGSLPVLVYSHGGDGGVSIDNEVIFVLTFFADLADQFVFVVPSFRSESIRFGVSSWTSDGPPSPWDYDVDDALSLVSVAGQIEPAADMTRVGIVGFSRGAGVALLMAERDPRIDTVVEFFGPTDFFGPFVQDVTEEALMGNPRDLPGLDFLNENYLTPLKEGTVTIASLRPELVRRSPILFADALPDVQVHHGKADTTVPVTQAERFIAAMESMGRMTPSFESYLYDGGEHNPLTLTGSLDRTRAFLQRLVVRPPS